MNILLWVLQVLLAIGFLLAGVPKLILSMATLKSMASPNAIALPDMFIRFIGVCEVLGALGLVLPGLFKTRQYLIPLAAVGLLIIMIGAAVVTTMGDGPLMGLIPLVYAVLLAFVAYGRWRLRPLG